jgi:galactose mutarotase-like enzyme
MSQEINLSNNYITAGIKKTGAELFSLINKENNLEYMWQAGKEWPKHSPVLFPIVGTLKENQYIYKGKKYSLERHGFARTMIFDAEKKSETEATFTLKSNNETKRNYPFEFTLTINYKLIEHTVEIKYIVTNIGNDELFFSIGAHPAFKIPLMRNEKYSDYFLEFNKIENADRWLLENGLIANREKFFNNAAKLQLSKDLFFNDALVFKGLNSDCISLKGNNHGLNFRFRDFPYFGIWAAHNADFVCLEPWHGIADDVNSSQDMTQKEGIIKLEAGNEFKCCFAIEIY